jgi:hypothetical protein
MESYKGFSDVQPLYIIVPPAAFLLHSLFASSARPLLLVEESWVWRGGCPIVLQISSIMVTKRAAEGQSFGRISDVRKHMREYQNGRQNRQVLLAWNNR